MYSSIDITNVDIRNLDIIPGFSNNCIFQEVMKVADILRRFLSEIYKHDVGPVKYIESEKSVSIGTNDKSSRYDIMARDEAGNIYIVEMESTGKFEAKRARFYSSIIDVHMLKAGNKHKELDRVTVVAITKTDQFRQGQSIYRFKNIDSISKNVELGDGVEHIYLNTNGDGKNISKAMQEFLMMVEDISIVDESMLTTSFAIDVYRKYKEVIKDDEKRGEAMFWEVREEFHAERNRNEGIIIGRAEGQELGRAEGQVLGQEKGINSSMEVIRLYKQGYTNQDISLMTGMAIDKVIEIVAILKEK